MPEDIIIAFLLGSSTTLVGSFVNHLFSKDRDMRREFNEAANAFQNTFERILATIHENPDLSDRQIVSDILIKNYPDQKIAMGSLSRQMWYIKKRSFRKAWQKYVNPEDCGSEPFLSYCGTSWEVGKSYDREYILKAIEHLISFAN